MTVAKSAPTIAEKYAAETLAKVNGELTAEASRKIYLAAAGLVGFARDAEQAAFMSMSAIESGDLKTSHEFADFYRAHLGKVKENLIFLGQLINAKAAG